MSRHIFDHLYEELVMLKGEWIPRMRIWNAVGDFYDPVALTKEEAVIFLTNFAATLLPEVPAKKRLRMIKRFKRWDPDADTPEEIFTRICGGKSQDT